jgi:hypothetical protein
MNDTKGVPRDQRPTVKLVGEDGNVFALLGSASRALKRAGLRDKAKEMTDRVMNSDSYEQALRIMLEYVKDQRTGDTA